jgi:hypothetical protein
MTRKSGGSLYQIDKTNPIPSRVSQRKNASACLSQKGIVEWMIDVWKEQIIERKRTDGSGQ